MRDNINQSKHREALHPKASSNEIIVMTKCPKCNYQRKPTDAAPAWQCPSCQVVYAKAARATANYESVRSPTSSSRTVGATSGLAVGSYVKNICMVLVFLGLIYGGYSFSQKMDMRRVEDSPVAAADKTVVVYSSLGCGYCSKYKKLLDEKKISYEEYDIKKSEKGKQDFKELHGFGVPIVVVGDKVLHGYDEKALLALLRYKGVL